MADSLIRLRISSEEYDNKLKRAAEGLNRYIEGCRKAGGTLEHVDDGVKEFTQQLGKMGTVAGGAKGKLGEMTKAFTDLTMQFNEMSEAEKHGQFGKALSAGLDELKQRIISTKKELADINSSLNGGATGGGSLFSSDKLSGMLQVFGGNLMTKGAGMVMSFAGELKDMVAQGIELAKAGEGVRLAFQRLGRGDILQGLREATHGTVTDLELMKAAVKFNDFKLPLDELGTMLAFAQQKAKDTGQSVDYMVESITNGLGRKSLMILDNLGLSAAEVKEKMAETGDMTKAVGAIIREQMSKAGDYVETAADRATQANVSLQNKMEELGRKFGPLEQASSNLWTSIKIGIMDIVGGPLTDFLNKLTEAGRLAQKYSVLGGSGKVGRMINNLSGAREGNRQSIYQQQQEQFWRYINPREQQIRDIRAWQRGERGEALQKRVSAITEKYGSLDATKIQAEVDAARKMLAEYQQSAKQILTPVKVDIKTDEAEQNVASLTKKLKELQEQRKKAIAAGDTELSKNLLKQINQTKADIKGLRGGTTTTTGGANGNTFDASKIVFTGGEGFKADPNTLKADPNANFLSVWGMMGGDEGLRQMMGIGKQQFDLGRDITEKDYKKLPGYKEDKETRKLTDEISTLTSGLSSIAGGLKSMGIDLPEEVDQVIGVIQGVTSVIEGVNAIISIFSTSAMSANTAALIANTIALNANTVTSFLPFANGGVVPTFAQGGLIGRAADGMMIPGNSMSGDRLRLPVDGGRGMIGVNSGELILNRAQQGVIASQLEGGVGAMQLSAIITGEQLRLVLNNNGRRTGRGEYVTTNFR